MNPALERVLRWFFPRRCALCGTVVALDEPLCPDCQKVRPIARPKCLLCGRSKKDCTCKGKHHEYAGVTAPFVYRDSLVTAIHNLKFYDFPMLADYMGDCMAAAVRVDFADVAFDYVAAVPLGRRRRRKRGYNQAELLARELSVRFQIPVNSSVLYKHEGEKQMALLNKEERRKNIKGLYDIKGMVNNQTILLIDDIVTTGETLRACAAQLKKAGAGDIYCLAIARTDIV